MLPPEYLASVADSILDLYAAAELEILQNMAERLSKYDYWIPAVDFQNLKLKETGRAQEDILRVLSQLSTKTEEELKMLMREATTDGLRADIAVYEAAGEVVPSIEDSVALVNVLNAGYRATRQTMRNLTATTAVTGGRQFERALDLAWTQIKSGAFSYDMAITHAVKSLTRSGLGAVTYPSGHIEYLETAVRRAVVTGINQTTCQLQDALAEELGCDLVEVTAHEGARPEHAEWQGKIYSRSGSSDKYPDFVESTGYGSGDGLGGWNCRHSYYPYIEGAPRAYTPEMLARFDAKEIEYQGEKLTRYEANQKQRYMERQIRGWKREEAALAAAGEDSSAAGAKVKEWQKELRNFTDETGLKRQRAREQI